MKTMVSGIAALVLLFAGAGQTRAGVIAADMDGFTVTADLEATIGWEFTLSTTITVTHLGVMGPGQLNGDHDIAIWASSGGAPLVQGTVLTTDPLTDLFRYTAVAPTVLGPGTYVIAAENDAKDVSGSEPRTFRRRPASPTSRGGMNSGSVCSFPPRSKP